MSGSNNSFRPGLVLGNYPENSAKDETWLEQSLATYLLGMKARKQFSQAKLNATIASIEEAGESLKQMPDDVLQMSIAGMRMRLAHSDDDNSLSIQTFAIIREVAHRVLGLRHFPSQLKGGWVIYNGMLAEMQTGEGKTLTATLPAATVAMSGIPVHVITSNDYLAKRDAEEMRPVYEWLGLTVGSVYDGMDMEERKAAYKCDITYCTNKQIAFDYLRDRIARGNADTITHLKLQRLYKDDEKKSDLLLRGLYFAVVDEADSVLIDEARTPLILSNPVPGGEKESTYHDALKLSAQLSIDSDFIIHAHSRSAELTKRGKENLKELVETYDPIWKAGRRREELVCQALVAEHVFTRDIDYLVKDDKVQIIDGYTGRLMPDRSWERGLHQMVEMKEGCPISDDKETLARISYQRFFRRYLKLGGMTGTVNRVEHEMVRVYRLPMVRIPTHKPCLRKTLRPRTFINTKYKNKALIKSVSKLIKAGRPVLIGTRSVEMSERLGILLKQNNINAAVLNARQDDVEAEIIAKAGIARAVTVATNMAGRGTDIKLSDEARANGGLHVIVTERNEASRIDRQLIGRCSRQGDPGSYQMMTAMDDELSVFHYSIIFRFLLRFIALWRGELPGILGNSLMNYAQTSLENQHQRARRVLEKQDERLGEMLAFTGRGE